MNITGKATFGGTVETFMTAGRILYLVIVWGRLLFGAFLRFEGKGSSQPLPSLKQCICTTMAGITSSQAPG